MSKRKVCVVTGTRAEYGLLFPIMQKIKASALLELQLVATTMHMSEDFGLTYQQIESDGFVIDEKVENLLSSNSKSSVVKSTGLLMTLMSDVLERLQPDVVLLLGDRYETHGAATAALLMNIPIAHIHGGEMTEGAVDEQIRHAITKMSYLHFTSTEIYRERVLQMGEESQRVYHVGAPGIDNMMSMSLMSKLELEKNLGWKCTDSFILFTYHPVTLGNTNLEKEMNDIFMVLKKSNLNILFTYANADDGGKFINQQLEIFCNQNVDKYKVVKSLGQLRYLSAMKFAGTLVGNTSSGIIEAASFHKPVVNIGDRQKGRLQSGNVIDCSVLNLESAIVQALSTEFQRHCTTLANIYGDGRASTQICQVLETASLSTVKKFADMRC